MARRIWKSTEVAWLRANYQKLGAKACAEHFGGTTDEAVIKTARRYGIAQRAADLHRPSSEWVDAVIRQCHASGSQAPWLDASGKIGRPARWVRYRAAQLGLHVQRPWTKGETDFVLKRLHWPAHRIASEMRANGWRRTQHAVEHFLKREGLNRADGGHLSGDAAARCLGVSYGAVNNWIRSGLLIAERRDPESSSDRAITIAEEDLAAFILLHPERVNLTKIEVAQTKAWFLDLISRFPKPPSRNDAYLQRQIASLRTFRPDFDNERIATTLNVEEKTVREAASRARELELQRDRARAQRRQQREAA